MHLNRTGAVLTRRRLSTPPPLGAVQGLGPVDAVRIDVGPAQQPWLAQEIDVLEYSLADELADLRRRHRELPAHCEQRPPEARDLEQQLDRRARQLTALTMIRDQVPISSEAARIGTAAPWDSAADGTADAPNRDAEPVAVVGPAALMTIAIRSVMSRVADALAEALRARQLDVDYWSDSTAGWRGRELPRISPTAAATLRATATAAAAFTDTYLQLLALQSYSLGDDPRHDDAIDCASTADGAQPRPRPRRATGTERSV
jgi:hypothetical protein